MCLVLVLTPNHKYLNFIFHQFCKKENLIYKANKDGRFFLNLA